MKLSARDATGYFARPDPGKAGLLIFGPDAMRVALKRQQVIAALVGPEGESEMRLTRLPASDLRGDPAALSDATRVQSFFPGPRVVFVDMAPDNTAKAVASALEQWQAGDAQIIITAGNLKPTSALRKLFEKHPGVYAAAVYANPPSRAEIEASLAAAGLRDLPRGAMDDLSALAHSLDPGDFTQTVEKLALYKIDDPTPVSAKDIMAIAPTSTEAGIDDLVNVVAAGRTDQLGATMKRLKDQGVAPVAMCIGTVQHFRALFTIAAHPGGASEGVARLRPPLYGPRRDAMQRQAQAWGADRLETALGILMDTDLSLRSGGATAPPDALVERALFKLTFLGRR